jgi:hypothetical protein
MATAVLEERCPIAVLAAARLQHSDVDAAEHIARLNCHHGVPALQR